jgi:hypothetical protein
VTPYQQRGLTGGYEDRRVGPTLFFVNVKGNGFTGETTLVGYFHRRAAELCQSIGFSSYSFNSNTVANTTRGPTTYSANTTYGYNSMQTEVRENPGMSVTKYAVSGYINCNAPYPQDATPQPQQYPGYPPAPPEPLPTAPAVAPAPAPRPPLTIADAISARKEVQRSSSIPVGCETSYIQGVPSMVMLFRDSKDADSLLGPMAKQVAGPFCAAANSANREASVFIVIGNRSARHYSCEMGDWGPWFELKPDDQQRLPLGTQSL